jgi:hypothetical protein
VFLVVVVMEVSFDGINMHHFGAYVYKYFVFIFLPMVC